jgi:hypothetical protein
VHVAGVCLSVCPSAVPVHVAGGRHRGGPRRQRASGGADALRIKPVEGGRLLLQGERTLCSLPPPRADFCSCAQATRSVCLPACLRETRGVRSVFIVCLSVCLEDEGRTLGLHWGRGVLMHLACLSVLHRTRRRRRRAPTTRRPRRTSTLRRSCGGTTPTSGCRRSRGGAAPKAPLARSSCFLGEKAMSNNGVCRAQLDVAPCFSWGHQHRSVQSPGVRGLGSGNSSPGPHVQRPRMPGVWSRV